MGYPAKLKIPDLIRGDTFSDIYLTDVQINNCLPVILEARAHIRAFTSKLIHVFEVEVSGNDVLLKGAHFDETKNFPIGRCKMDVEVTFAEFGRFTILKSEFNVIKDETYDDE